VISSVHLALSAQGKQALEAALVAQAKAKGMSVDSLLRKAILLETDYVLGSSRFLLFLSDDELRHSAEN